jgi:LEA14-like dessication related protein
MKQKLLKYMSFTLILLSFAQNSCHTYVAVPLDGRGNVHGGVAVHADGPVAAFTLLGVLIGAAIIDANSSNNYYKGNCSVKLKIKPDSASVFLDGVYVGMAGEFDGKPDRLNVTEGKHTLIFKAKGYKTYKVNIQMTNGMTAKITKILEKSTTDIIENTKPMYNEIKLKLDIKPKDAQVTIDGVLIGTGEEISKLHGPLIVDGNSEKLTISYKTEYQVFDLQKLAKEEQGTIKIKLHFTKDIYE